MFYREDLQAKDGIKIIFVRILCWIPYQITIFLIYARIAVTLKSINLTRILSQLFSIC